MAGAARRRRHTASIAGSHPRLGGGAGTQLSTWNPVSGTLPCASAMCCGDLSARPGAARGMHVELVSHSAKGARSSSRRRRRCTEYCLHSAVHHTHVRPSRAVSGRHVKRRWPRRSAAANDIHGSICGSPAYHRTELLRRRDQRTVATTSEWLARGDEEDRHRTLDPTRVKASDGVERGPSSYCPRIPSPDPSCASRPNARPRCHPTWPAAIWPPRYRANGRGTGA